INDHYSNQIRYLILDNCFFSYPVSSNQQPESPGLEQPIHFSLLTLFLFGSACPYGGLSRLGIKSYLLI
ncbi:hypothetical protein KJ656_09405, partial [bacterium]|nr:hypothetical protein [bacterium]